ncbi:MAG: helix-turn-helix transcriptional regulator [Pseudomonadota bacterium]
MASRNINAIVGGNIQTIRERNGLNPSDLASLTEVPEVRLLNIEGGDIRATVEELHALKTALKAEIKEFYKL